MKTKKDNLDKKRHRLIKHTSIYRGSLMTFQHYLNTHYSVLPFEAREDGGTQLYRISEWYDRGMLIKVVIERDKDFKFTRTP